MKIPSKNLSHITKSLGYGDRPCPLRDWLLLLALTLVLLLVSVGWNLWNFDKVTDGEALTGTTQEAPVAEAPIDQVNALFERRAQEAARYESEYRLVDPSR